MPKKEKKRKGNLFFLKRERERERREKREKREEREERERAT